jgi:hypothetical protein
VNSVAEVLEALKRDFEPVSSTYYPTRVPSPDVNLAVGLRLKKR